MQLASLGSFTARRNPAVDSIDSIYAAVQRAHKLASHLERVTRNHTKIETDPDVMQICANFLANLVDTARVKLDGAYPVSSLSEDQKAVLHSAWNCAKHLEAEAKRLRRDPDWKTWTVLSERKNRTWQNGEAAAQSVKHAVNRANADLENERNTAVLRLLETAHRLFQATTYASEVLRYYGYDKMDTQISRQAYFVDHLPRLIAQ